MKDGGISRRAFLPASAALFGASALAISGSTQTAEAQAPGTTLLPGVHRIGANTVIKGDLLLQPGATIEVAAGRTLTLLGGLIAPIAPIFTGPGVVDLNKSRIVCAHPEWWGAAPGDGARDSLPALVACLRAHPAMRLLAADYYIADTFVVDRPFCSIVGAGYRGATAGQGTRLIVTNGVADVMRVGPASAPSSVNDFPQNIDIRAVALARSVAVDTGGGRLPAGLRAQFLLFAHFEQISASEHAIGFSAQGLVRSIMSDCVAFRSIPGRQAQQPYRGFLLDGSTAIGLAGGNASLYLIDCNVTIGGRPAIADSVGLLLEGAFADSFIVNFEATALETGIRVDGRTAALGGRARDGHVNLHLRMPIVDQCTRVGIEVRDTSPDALIDIADLYVAVAPGAEAALRFEAMRGAASIMGGQLIGTINMAARGGAIGVAAQASHGLQINGLKILEHPRPVVFAGCSGFALRLLIANPDFQPGGDAVALHDCEGGIVELLLSARAGAFKAGIALGHIVRMRIDTTGIDAAAVGGAMNRVTAGGRPLAIPFHNADLIVEGP